MFLFCLPTENRIFAPISTLLRLGRLAGLAWSILIFFMLKIYSEKALWPVWLFIFTALFSTCINATNIRSCISMVFPIFSTCVITVHIMKLKGFQGVKAIASIFAVLLILQALSALAGGLGTFVDANKITVTNYFFVQRVSFNDIFIFAIALLTLTFFYDRKRRWLYVTGGLCGIYFILYEWVATAIMTFLVYIMVFIVARIIKSDHVWRNMLIFLFSIAALFVIVGFSFDAFEWILVDLLGKDVTLHGRTLLWAQAVANIHGWHWILGNGYGHAYMFWIGDWGVDTAHSQYLNILFCFGLVGFVLYFLIIYQFLKGLRKRQDERYKRLIAATVAAIIVSGISTTTYTSIYLYLLYTVFVLPKYWRHS